jgi:septal ring factor EnvC (AmiA/AmiB activator)
MNCPLRCGSCWEKREYNPKCYACILKFGMTFDFDEIEAKLPYLHDYWQETTVAKTNEKLYATELKLQASEAKASELQRKLQTSEAKASELQANLQASEAKASELQANLQASEAKVAELQAKLLSRFAITDI